MARVRIGNFLARYAGAVDTPYVRAVGQLSLIAAVRRARNPGAKFDEMLVLESGQGKNKSTAFEILATRPEWFTNSVPLTADSREMLEHVEGKIFAEVAELQGMRKGDIEHIKAMLSRTTDRGRMAYDRYQTERKRQFVFIGTSNGRSYLRDDTGNRRFWPVAVKEFDLAALRRDVDLIWGEAATLESSVDDETGEPLSIRLDPSLYQAAEKEQAKRLEIHEDPLTDALQSYLGEREGKIANEDVWQILWYRHRPPHGRPIPAHGYGDEGLRMAFAEFAQQWRGSSRLRQGRRRAANYCVAVREYHDCRI